ncbi:MAG: hypothetical protein LUD27_04790, partial [Clostridia bacterium]|nr:hypothetical protein [Clostridia bacterium]
YKMFDAEVQKELNKSISNFYSTNKNYKKAFQLASEYNMESWDDLVKKNTKAINELKTSIEKG